MKRQKKKERVGKREELMKSQDIQGTYRGRIASAVFNAPQHGRPTESSLDFHRRSTHQQQQQLLRQEPLFCVRYTSSFFSRFARLLYSAGKMPVSALCKLHASDFSFFFRSFLSDVRRYACVYVGGWTACKWKG